MKISENFKKIIISKPYIFDITLLVIIAIFTHIQWFNPVSVLTSGDWGHASIDVTKKLSSSWAIWSGSNNFGSLNIQLSFYPFIAVWSILGKLGINYDIASKITFFIPIAALNLISPYLLSRKLVKSRAISIIGALFYATTTYGIANQPPIQFVYALAPLILLLFMRAIEKNSIFEWLSFTTTFFIGMIYEVRIMYIVSIILVFYLFTSKIRKLISSLKYLFLVGPLLILLNLYWLLPTFKSGSTEKISAVANRGLFGNDLYDLPHALTLSNWYWNGGLPNDAFVKQAIPITLWLVPIVIIGCLIYKSRKLDKVWVSFLLIALLGITLTKQVSAPVTWLYPWLYAHFPGFNLFREASKFFLLTAIGYLGLIVFGLFQLRSSSAKLNYKYTAAIAALTLSVFVNLLPTITGQIGGLFISHPEPRQYELLDSYLRNVKYMANTFWLPATSRWSYYSDILPVVSAVDVSQNSWASFHPTRLSSDIPIQESILDAISSSYAETLFDSAAVEYFVVPLRDSNRSDDLYRFYGDSPGYFLNKLENLGWLKKINTGITGINVFENINAKPFISTFKTLYNFQDMAKLEQYTKFATTLGGTETNFTVSENTRSWTTDITDPFLSDIKTTAGTNVLTMILPKTKKARSIFQQQTPTQLSYSRNGLKLQYSESTDDFADKLVQPERQISAVQNGAINLDPSTNYFITDGTSIDQILGKNYQAQWGQVTKDVKFASGGKNLLQNGSFEDGLWNDKLVDCSPFDRTPNISANIVGESYDGNNALELKTSSHIACMPSNNVSVIGNQDYVVQFEYQVIRGQSAGYRLNFNNSNGDSPKEVVFNASGNGWTKYTAIVHVPPTATQLSIELEAFRNDRDPITGITRYDNVSLSPLNSIAVVKNNSNAYNPTPLEGIEQTTTYSDPNYTLANIFPNPSLENGTWQKTVGDCNAYDDKAQIDMKLDTTNKTDGKQSLKLTAKRHAACTGPDQIIVVSGGTYTLRFDYRGVNTQSTTYRISFNDSASTSDSELLPVNDTAWHTLSRQITIPRGADKMSIVLYARSDETGLNQVTNEYDNFSLINMPNSESIRYIVDEPVQKTSTPLKTAFSFQKATLATVSIGGASGPFFLSMANNYNSNWRLYTSKNNESALGWLPNHKENYIDSQDHFELNGFQNGWYIDVNKICEQDAFCEKNSDGSYNFQLVAEFTPQRWFYVGAIVSGVTLIGVADILAYLGIRRYLQRRDQKRNGGEPVPTPKPAEVAKRVVKKAKRVVRL